MEVKKSLKADLEKQKSTFTQLGLVVVMGLMFIAFEWSESDLKTTQINLQEEVVLEEDAIPVTRQEQLQPPPPPPPPRIMDVLNIVDDDIKLEDELEIENTEIDQNTEINISDVSTNVDEVVEDVQVFQVVEESPKFPGGDAELMKFLSNNIKYPTIAQENGIQGRVYVKFVVWKDGSIRNVEVGRGVDPYLDQEAVRVVKAMPKWNPGKQRGVAVNVSYMLPVNFVLN